MRSYLDNINGSVEALAFAEPKKYEPRFVAELSKNMRTFAAGRFLGFVPSFGVFVFRGRVEGGFNSGLAFQPSF